MLSADPKKFLLLTQEHYVSTVTASLFKDTHQFYWFQWRKLNDLSSLFLTASLLIKEAFPHCFGARLQPAPLLHSGWPLNPWLRWPFTEKSPLMWSAEKPDSRQLWLRHSKQIVLLSALDAAILTSRTGIQNTKKNKSKLLILQSSILHCKYEWMAFGSAIDLFMSARCMITMTSWQCLKFKF